MKIKPFTDYYMNCYLNNLFSLLSSIEPSFQQYAYMNSYNYQFSELENNDVVFIRLKNSIDFYLSVYNNLFSKSLTIEFKSNREFMLDNIQPLGQESVVLDEELLLSEIKSFLGEGKVAFVGVDLFYLIPKSPFYNHFHRSHYLLVLEYDSHSDSFLSLDEGPLGYGVHHIPVTIMINAMKKAKLLPKCFFFSLPKKIRPITLDITTILQNADQIIHSIETIGEYPLNNDKKYVQDYAYELRKISERQKGNQMLFQVLMNQKYIDESVYYHLSEKVNILKQRWLGASNLLLKSKAKGVFFDMNEGVKKYYGLLQDEILVWRYFKQAVLKD